MNKILLVDDSEIDRSVAKMALEEKSFQIIEAENGETALQILKENSVDLILLDVMMPNLNGFETCKIIKSMPELKSIPIIFILFL